VQCTFEHDKSKCRAISDRARKTLELRDVLQALLTRIGAAAGPVLKS